MRLFARLRTAIAATVGCLSALPGLADDTPSAAYRISGPHVHENLAVYLVHGASKAGPVPLTLQEAIANDGVRVVETGSVNQLEIENIGTQDVFIQAGDIVKGGKQDRVLTVSLLLTPGAGKVPIGAFCVEQGRWAARGTEDVKRFASAETSMPSREAKLAMALPAKQETAAAAPAGPAAHDANLIQRRQAHGGVSETSNRQQAIWDKVKKTQDKLASNLGASVAARQSQSSLQLSLENERLKQAQTAYLDALQAAPGQGSDIIGLVIAVNGKLSTADVYLSNGVFRKMWIKQLKAGITEAIGEKNAGKSTPSTDAAGERPVTPSVDTVAAFLRAAETGRADERIVGGRMKLQTRDADQALMVEASRADGRFVHRNYLAK